MWQPDGLPRQPPEYDEAPHQPQPIEGLHEIGPTPFLTKTYDMVDDVSIDNIVSWNRGGYSFVMWDPYLFSTSVLPKYFKHNNFSSFARQLNNYGFRKIDPDKWEFSNDYFRKGHKKLLSNIKRKKTSSQPFPNQEIEIGIEIEGLRRDKQVFMMELGLLKQKQVNSRAHLQEMELKLQSTEKKQQQMMSFLARAMQNPEFIDQLIEHKKKNKEIEKKRRRMIEVGESSKVREGENLVKSEPLEFEVSELEALALEIQGFGRENEIRFGSYDKELDQGFWEELLDRRFEDGGD